LLLVLDELDDGDLLVLDLLGHRPDTAAGASETLPADGCLLSSDDYTETGETSNHAALAKDLLARTQRARVLPGDTAATATALGRLTRAALARIMRQRVREETRRFSNTYHAPAPFVAGATHVPYAARVYDSREVEAAVDASLEFWLTLGSHG